MINQQQKATNEKLGPESNFSIINTFKGPDPLYSSNWNKINRQKKGMIYEKKKELELIFTMEHQNSAATINICFR